MGENQMIMHPDDFCDDQNGIMTPLTVSQTVITV